MSDLPLAVTDFEEEAWWGNCGNTWHEEQKQFSYAKRMGLSENWNCGHPPEFSGHGLSIIDIGGGPASLLLKTTGDERRVVLDPIEFPWWVRLRYEECGIEFWHMRAEDLGVARMKFDEAWIYNVLQHVYDPRVVIHKARAIARTVRVFEWIEIDPYPGHPHRLERNRLDRFLGGNGTVEDINENGAVGRAYYGVFSGK